MAFQDFDSLDCYARAIAKPGTSSTKIATVTLVQSTQSDTLTTRNETNEKNVCLGVVVFLCGKCTPKILRGLQECVCCKFENDATTEPSKKTGPAFQNFSASSQTNQTIRFVKNVDEIISHQRFLYSIPFYDNYNFFAFSIS